LRLQDKTAVITGAGKGIGAAIALRFNQEGAKLLLLDLDETNAVKLADELNAAGGHALAFQVDVTDRQAVDKVIKDAILQFGTIDILVNNAGIVRDALAQQNERGRLGYSNECQPQRRFQYGASGYWSYARERLWQNNQPVISRPFWQV